MLSAFPSISKNLTGQEFHGTAYHDPEDKTRRYNKQSYGRCQAWGRDFLGHRFGWGPHRFACLSHPCRASGPFLINLIVLNSDGGSYVKSGVAPISAELMACSTPPSSLSMTPVLSSMISQYGLASFASIQMLSSLSIRSTASWKTSSDSCGRATSSSSSKCAIANAIPRPSDLGLGFSAGCLAHWCPSYQSTSKHPSGAVAWSRSFHPESWDEWLFGHFLPSHKQDSWHNKPEDWLMAQARFPQFWFKFGAVSTWAQNVSQDMEKMNKYQVNLHFSMLGTSSLSPWKSRVSPDK